MQESIDKYYDPKKTRLPKFAPDELLGLTFLHDTEDGQKVRAEVVKRINDIDSENHKNIKFMISFGSPSYEEIISYGELSSLIERQHAEEPAEEERLYIFKKSLSHHGPYGPNDPEYLGSSWNLRIQWEDGSIAKEPLCIIGKDDPASCAKYGLEHNLLEAVGWKRFKRLSRRTKKMERMIKQANFASNRSGPLYMFGVRVPISEQEAREFDKECVAKFGEPRWFISEKTEIKKLNEYESFREHFGKNLPKGYRCIKLFFGDNEGAIKSSTIPASTLKKKHNALSYHTVHAAISAGIIEFRHTPGKINPADMLTKHLEPRDLEPLTRPLLF